MFVILVSMALSIFVSACDDGGSDTTQNTTQDTINADTNTTDDTSTIQDTTPDTTPTGPRCAGAECSVVWADSEVYPVPVDHHTTLIYGDTLYVLGGVEADFSNPVAVYDAVRSAAINPTDGTLGPWESAGTLPLALAFHAQATDGARVYVTGGLSMDAQGPFASGVTLVGEIGADKTITWTQATDASLTASALHASTQILDGELILTGGTSANAPGSAVLISTLDNNGLPGAWREGPPLPDPRSHHASVVHEGRIYLLGGFNENNRPLESVLVSVHDAAGALTGWEVAGELPSSPWTHGAFVHEGYVWIVGGGQGGPGQEEYIATVRRAPFLTDGQLGPFDTVKDPLPIPRSHVHQTPTHNGRIYSVGGRLSDVLDSMDRVFIGTME